MDERPILTIALGDAAGVGPEITAKALLDEGVRAMCRPLLVGNKWVLERAFALAGGRLAVRQVSSAAEARFEDGVLDLLEMDNLDPADVTPGRVNIATGRESGETMVRATHLVQRGEAQGIVSAPVNKAALGAAGFGHGHAQVIANALGWKEPVLSLLSGPKLKVLNMTGHCSLAEACRRVTFDLIVSSLETLNTSFQRWGYTTVRIAVAALNPHAGDAGAFGQEEIEVIGPAVKAAQSQGIGARGPFAADTLFARALDGEFDMVLAMYHD